MSEFRLALETDWGEYDMRTVDLTWRVRNGEWVEPPGVDPPFLVLGPPSRIQDIYGEAPLGEYDQSGEMDFIGFAPCDSFEHGPRIAAALDMAEEMERQLYTTRDPDNAATYPLCYGHLLKLWMTVEGVSAGGGELVTPHATFWGSIYWRRVTVGGV
jgi:hypothetical protein